MSMITIIGRGHSGTRAISQTLYASGVFMGDVINKSGDMIPPEDMYEACRVMARYVEWKGGPKWDFAQLHDMPFDPAYLSLLGSYLKPVLESSAKHKGWKIPETTLIFPWIARMFPEMKYIYWIRNPRDCILRPHKTDDLHDFGIDYPETEDVRLRRAISWKYQYDIVKDTPQPENWLEVRFEDFILHQEEQLERLEDYLGIKLARVIVNPEAVDRWRQDHEANYFDFFEPAALAYGYDVPNGREP